MSGMIKDIGDIFFSLLFTCRHKGDTRMHAHITCHQKPSACLCVGCVGTCPCLFTLLSLRTGTLEKSYLSLSLWCEYIMGVKKKKKKDQKERGKEERDEFLLLEQECRKKILGWYETTRKRREREREREFWFLLFYMFKCFSLRIDLLFFELQPNSSLSSSSCSRVEDVTRRSAGLPYVLNAVLRVSFSLSFFLSFSPLSHSPGGTSSVPRHTYRRNSDNPFSD